MINEANRVAEAKRKEFLLKERKVNRELENLDRSEEAKKAFDNIDFGYLNSEEYGKKLSLRSNEFIEAAQEKMTFIMPTEEFDLTVPFYKKNLIGIGAVSGEGKSTCSANIALGVLRQRKKVLVISNEENAEDVYNRVIALGKGWHYGNHDKISPEQKDEYAKLIPVYVKNGLTVIDQNSFEGIERLTTSIEGLRALSRKLINDANTGNHFDVVIFDYYQPYGHSIENPGKDGWKNLEEATEILEVLRKSYPAPIVVMFQLKPGSEESGKIWKERIEGSKSISNRLTCCFEIKAKKSESTTEWILHKSRYNAFPSGSFQTGWDRGMYVQLTEQFKNMIINRKLEALERKKK